MDRIVKFSFLALLLVSTYLAQSTTPPPAADPVYTQLRSLKLSGETVTVSELTMRRDAGVFFFHRGEFHLSERVNGKTLAAVFIGSGEFRMQPPIAVEKHNLA